MPDHEEEQVLKGRIPEKWNRLKTIKQYIRKSEPVRIVDIETEFPNVPHGTIIDSLRELEYLLDVRHLPDGRLVSFDYQPLAMAVRQMVAQYRRMHMDPFYNPPIETIAHLFGRAPDDRELKDAYTRAVVDQDTMIPTFLELQIQRHHERLGKLSESASLRPPTLKDVVNGLLRLALAAYDANLRREKDILWETWKQEVSKLTTAPVDPKAAQEKFLKQMAEIVANSAS